MRAPPSYSHWPLASFLAVDWKEFVELLRSELRSGWELGARSQVVHRDFALDVSLSSRVGPHRVSGARISSAAESIGAENQLMALFSDEGHPELIISSQWISPFRAAALAVIALEGRCDVVRRVAISGAGPVAMAAAIVLSDCATLERIDFLLDDTSRFRDNLEVVRLRTRTDVGACDPVDFSKALGASDVWIFASSKSYWGSETGSSSAAVLHLGAKYDGAWAAPTGCAEGVDPWLVDSLSQFREVESRLSVRPRRATCLTTGLASGGLGDASCYYLSLGGAGADVLLVDFLRDWRPRLGRFE
jgi:hypothetical protein